MVALCVTFVTSCSSDSEDDNFNYQETMAKYENTSFQHTNEVGTFNLDIMEMYELNGETHLAAVHFDFIGISLIRYDKNAKTFMFEGTHRDRPGETTRRTLKFIDDNTILLDGSTYTKTK